MTFYGDFTLAKDEAFGDYHVDISQKSDRHIRATVKTYEKTGVYIFVKLFKKKTDGEFTLWQKICFTKEEFEKLLGAGNLILQPPTVKKVTKKPKKSKKTVVVEEDDDDSGEANKENIDPNRKHGGSNV